MAKRRKRLFPKKYLSENIPVPRIDHAKAAAYNLQRSKATVGPRGDTEHKLDNSFLHEVPESRRAIFYKNGKRYYAPSERYNTLEKKHQLTVVEQLKENKDLFGLYRIWQSGFRNQGVTEFNKMYLDRSENYSLMLFFAGDKYLFVQEVLEKNIRRISRVYQVREDMYSEAIKRKDKFEIAWITSEPINKS